MLLLFFRSSSSSIRIIVVESQTISLHSIITAHRIAYIAGKCETPWFTTKPALSRMSPGPLLSLHSLFVSFQEKMPYIHKGQRRKWLKPNSKKYMHKETKSIFQIILSGDKLFHRAILYVLSNAILYDTHTFLITSPQYLCVAIRLYAASTSSIHMFPSLQNAPSHFPPKSVSNVSK